MDTRDIVSLLAMPIGIPIKNFLVSHAKDVLKPRVNRQPPDEWYLVNTNNGKRTIEEISVMSDGRELFAHKLKLTEHRGHSSEAKKLAIVYMPGNCPDILDSLPNMEPLLQEIIKNNKDDEVVCYCQHYRGRGSNQESYKENFNDYDQLQDARDQAMLIKKLVDEGYKQENILLLGYSYGSAVLISTVYHLVKQYGYLYSHLKAVSDRGYGNPFDLRVLKSIIYDHQAAQKQLYEQGMLPELPLHDIVSQYMPYSFVSYVEKDGCVWFDYSLANTFKENELPGRIMAGHANTSHNPHFANRLDISLKTIPEVKLHHFITAMLMEARIDLQFPSTFVKPEGYALSNDAKQGDDDYLVFAQQTEIKFKQSLSPSSMVIKTNTITILHETLHKYCLERAERGKNSNQGADYNNAWLGSTGLVGWTVKQQVEMAMRIMSYLYDLPNKLQQLRDLALEVGPHQSGELNIILTDVMDFAREYKQVTDFNLWTTSMAMKREEHIHNESVKTDALMQDWNEIKVETKERNGCSGLRM